jgi:RNA polymerase sigma-70 factor (ECF subfamily)
MTTLSPVKPQEDSLATRWSLVGRIKNTQDDKSWNEFHDLYRGLILGVAKKAGLQDAEALDVLQETMTAVSKNIGGFEANPERGSFRAWLLQMARWRIMDQLKKRLPISVVGSRSDNATETTPAVERVPDPREVDLERLCDAEWKEQLMNQALKEVQLQINAEHYQIFYLLEIERRTIPDVARMVGRNRAPIYLIRHRVTNALKKIVKRLERKAP